MKTNMPVKLNVCCSWYDTSRMSIFVSYMLLDAIVLEPCLSMPGQAQFDVLQNIKFGFYPTSSRYQGPKGTVRREAKDSTIKTERRRIKNER